MLFLVAPDLTPLIKALDNFIRNGLFSRAIFTFGDYLYIHTFGHVAS